MEETLYGFLEESERVLKIYQEVEKELNNSMNEINESIRLIEVEMFSKKYSNDQNYELRSYKSSLLKCKADLMNQVQETKKIIDQINQTIILFKKAIQLNTGDIF